MLLAATAAADDTLVEVLTVRNRPAADLVAVLEPLAGPGLTGWSIGVPGSGDRYGSGLGIGLNSYLVGLSGTPVSYYAPTPLLLTAEGGTFVSGRIRLALHLLRLEPPRAV